MTSRYQRDYDIDFKGAFSDPKRPEKKQNPWADALRFAGSAAPAVGTAIGALAGGAIGAGAGGVGAIPGASIGATLGNAIGSGAGALAGAGADWMTQGDEDAEMKALAQDEERRARQMAMMQLLGGLG